MTGCEHTPESLKIYEECEEKNAKLVRLIWRSGIIFGTGALSLPILFPVANILFGYPPTSMWQLPVPAK